MAARKAARTSAEGLRDSAPAVEAVEARFPPREVDVYLAALLALDPGTWEGVAELLESRRTAARA